MKYFVLAPFWILNLGFYNFVNHSLKGKKEIRSYFPFTVFCLKLENLANAMLERVSI